MLFFCLTKFCLAEKKEERKRHTSHKCADPELKEKIRQVVMCRKDGIPLGDFLAFYQVFLWEVGIALYMYLFVIKEYQFCLFLQFFYWILELRWPWGIWKIVFIVVLLTIWKMSNWHFNTHNAVIFWFKSIYLMQWNLSNLNPVMNKVPVLEVFVNS